MVLILALLPTLATVAGVPTNLGWLYYAGVAAVGILLVYEHYLVRPDDLNRVNIAFFNVNSVVSFGLFLIGTIDTIV